MPKPHPVLVDYGAAVLLTLIAILARGLLDPWLGDTQELSLMFAAVAVVMWRGGAGPAALATVLGYVGCDYFFIPPRGEFAVIDVRELVSLSTYLVSSAAVILFGEGQRRANQRAQDYAASLVRAEARKDEFLATLAHKLRNRLAPISNGVQALRYELPTGVMADLVARQVKHMTRLVDDLFDLSRIAAGQVALQQERIDLQTILNDAIEMAKPHIEAAGQTLSLNMPSEPICLYADATRLAQVFSNLLNNASRYSPPSSTIELAIQCHADAALVSVRDEGIGIPQEMRATIFDLFMRLDRPSERGSAGLGIGLTLARRLLELHGGRIEVASEGPGKGSEFLVLLPLAKTVSARAAPTEIVECLKS